MADQEKPGLGGKQLGVITSIIPAIQIVILVVLAIFSPGIDFSLWLILLLFIPWVQ